MKRLILWLALLLPFFANAQVNGTIQKTSATGTIRGSFGSLGLDTLPRVTGALVDGYILKYHAATNKWYASPDPTLVGLQDSLTKKANRTFDNVASGAIANVKLANSTISGVSLGSNLNALTLDYGLIGTSYNGSSAVTSRVDTTAIQTVSNFFPKGDTRYAKGAGNAVLTTGTQSIGGTKTFTSTVMASINTADAVISNFENTSATGFGSKVRGGFGSRYSFLVTDYNDASLLNISQGVGATFALRLKSPDFDWVRQSNFGYSSDYKTQIIGATSGNQTITFGVDPIANLGGGFSGNGSEYMFRNVGKFITPNSGNTDYNTLLSWNSSGGLLLPTLAGSGDVIAGADNTGLFGKITIGSGLSLTSGELTATGGSSGSVTTAGGTSGKIAKFTSASNIENSIMTEAGTDIEIAGSLTTTAGVDVKTNGGLRLWNAGNSGYGTLGYDGTNITSANSISGTTFSMSGRSQSEGLDVRTNSGFRLYNADNSAYAELTFNGTLIGSTHGFSAPSGTFSGTLSASNFSGSSSGTNTGDQTTITGNAGTATALQTARTIGTLTGDVTSAGSSFDGTGNNSNATTLATVNANVGSFGSSTSIPTFTVNGKGLITAASGNAVIAPAGTLTGTTLAAGVTASSLTSVGTLANLTVTNPITGSITGNAATVTTNANLTGVVTSTGNATAIADAALSIAKTSGLQSALDAKAPLASPALTGNPTAPTQTQGDNSTKIATTAYVDALGGTILAAQKQLSVSYSSVPSSIIGEVILNNYTIPLSSLSSDGDRIDFKVGGTLANNTNTKGFRIEIAGTNVTNTLSSNGQNIGWILDGTIIRTSSTTYKFIARSTNLGTNAIFYNGTVSGFSSGLTVQTIANTATSNSDLTLEMASFTATKAP